MSQLIYCQSCGSSSKYGSKNCSSCNESFSKIEPPRILSAGIVENREDSRENKFFNLPDITEDEAALEYDYSSLAAELENHLKNNSEQALQKTVSMQDILNGK